MSGNLVNKIEVEDARELTRNYINDSLQVDQKTLDDYYAFFSGKKIDMLPYVYAEPSDAYNALVHTPEYYLFKDEVSTIAHNQDILTKYLAGVTDIVEIGPGCDYTVENKTVPILNCAADLKRYYAIDYSENFLKEACRSVSKRKSDIEVSGVEADLMNGRIDLGKIPTGKKGVLFLGSTLGNFTEAQQQHAISQVASITKPKDVFILGIDTNRNSEVVVRAYANEYDDILMLNILRHFAKINPEFIQYLHSFKVEYIWDELDSSVKSYFVSMQDIKLKIMGKSVIQISQGQKIHAATSRKFGSQKIATILKNKFDILKTIGYSDKIKIYICSRI